MKFEQVVIVALTFKCGVLLVLLAVMYRKMMDAKEQLILASEEMEKIKASFELIKSKLKNPDV